MSTEVARAQQYWLWVTRPEFYFDADGGVSPGLDTSDAGDTGGWWTCHKETRRGDLVLLWRTTPMKDIAYLIQAVTDAYSIADDKFAAEHAWDWGCDYQVVHALSKPVTISELRAHPQLREWSPLLQQFQRRTFRIKPQDWVYLTQLARNTSPGFGAALAGASRGVVERITLEAELENALASDLSRLAPFGYDLHLYKDPESGVSGRQFICKGVGGRIDLLCVDRAQDRFVVVEFKNERAGRNTFGQISGYVGYVMKRIANGRPVMGLVVSRGVDTHFEAALAVTDRILQLDLSALGFK